MQSLHQGTLVPHPAVKSSFSPAIDYIISIALIVGMAIGLIGNVFSVKFYFSFSKKRPVLRYIYKLRAVTDSLICGFVAPVIYSLWNNREPQIFQIRFVCVLWGYMWDILPTFSLYITMALIVSRIWAVLRPLYKMEKRIIRNYIFITLVLISLGRFLFVGFGCAGYKYFQTDAYCWMQTNSLCARADFYYSSILLQLPVLVLFLSVVLSLLMKNKNYKEKLLIKAGAKPGQEKFLLGADTPAFLKAKKNPNMHANNPALKNIGLVLLEKKKIETAPAAAPKKKASFAGFAARKNGSWKQVLAKKIAKRYDHESTSILTLVIICVILNIPQIIQWLIYYFNLEHGFKVLNRSLYQWWYGWLFSMVICVLANSVLNPFVYYVRDKVFRDSLKCDWGSLRKNTLIRVGCCIDSRASTRKAATCVEDHESIV